MFLAQIERRLAQISVARPTSAAKPESTALDVPALELETAPPLEVVPSLPTISKELSPRPSLIVFEPRNYKPRILQRYACVYPRMLQEAAMQEGKKITAPISIPLYDRVTSYVAMHKGEEGYPQTMREFLTLAIEHLLIALDAETPEDQQIPA